MDRPPPLPAQDSPPRSRGEKAVVWVYVVGFCWAAPAVVAWLFSIIFVLPKLKGIWFHLSSQTTGGTRLHSLIYALFDAGDFTWNQGRLLVAVGCAGFGLVEILVFRRWPRLRRICLWLLAFTLNVFLILTLTWIAVLATILAEMAGHPP